VLGDLELNMTRLAQIQDKIVADRARWDRGRSLRQCGHDAAYARLLARFETQPAIEQAKGIIMAATPCDADQAFDILRRASQRENLPVREIAARIVGRASGPPEPRQPGSTLA